MQIDLFKEAVVWTKNNCASCELVKNLLNQYNYKLDLRDISNIDNALDLKKSVPGARTVPQVMINGKYIGGLQQVKDYLTRK